MRAPVQKTRPRRTGSQTASEGGAERTPVGKGRPTHVRNRLIVAVAVVAAAIAAAGAPSILAASGQLKDSQDLVTLAEQSQDALALAQSLADERDEVTTYVAAGRVKAKAPSPQGSARVDRQARELTTETDVSAALRKALGAVPSVRQSALTGKSTALQAHQAYSRAIAALHVLVDRLAEQMPPRAGSGAHALAELDSAVQQASATRGLLLAALNVPRPATRPPTTPSPAGRAPRRSRPTPTPSSATPSPPPLSRPGCAPTPPSPTSARVRPRTRWPPTTPRSPAATSTPPRPTSPPSPTSRS